MSVQQTLQIGADSFQFRSTVDEGQTFCFFAGSTIAVEKWDARPGSTEFDFQVMSRAAPDGRAGAIMSSREGLYREFNEARVKSNLFGLPISGGNVVAVARGRAAPELTYGELQPQVFRSRVTSNLVAWTLWFPRAHYVGMGGVPRIPGTAKPSAAARAGAATARAEGAAAMGAMSQRDPSLADGSAGPVGMAATLRVYILLADLAKFRVSPQRFDTHDMIFNPLTVFDRLRALVGR